MEDIYLILFIIILIAIVLYIIIYIIYPGDGNKDMLKKKEDLKVKKNIVMSDEVEKTILGSNGSTVMGFFYLNQGDRTKNYENQFTPIMEVVNNWALEVSPGTITKDNITARFRINTNNHGQFKQEIIELPLISKQKWVFIAILRDGRRFDIIYDNKIVASHRLEYYPVIISSPLSIGNKGLDGQVIHVMINDKRLSPSEIERRRLNYVDTNNRLVELNPINLSLPSLPGIKLLGQCPPGLPCDPITKPPTDNLYEWSTPYA